VICLGFLIAMTAPTLRAQERVPTPAEDAQMLHTFRANVLQELGLMDAYEQYRDPSKATAFPKQTGIAGQEEVRRWVFTLAIQRVQLDWMGYSYGNTGGSAAAEAVKSGFMSVLRRVFRTFTLGELAAVSGRWTADGGGRPTVSVDPKVADQKAAEGESAARALLREYLPEKAAAYESASMLQQADLLLEAGEAVTRARGWPTAYVLYLTDTSGGYQAREGFVKPFLGVNSPEYQQWPKMTDRQRGAATKQSILAALALSRRLAQRQIDVRQWMAGAGGADPFRDPQTPILLAGGQALWDRYNRASEPEQREIAISAALKTVGWLWTLQAAL
jgi:hypothetical protein